MKKNDKKVKNTANKHYFSKNKTIKNKNVKKNNKTSSQKKSKKVKKSTGNSSDENLKKKKYIKIGLILIFLITFFIFGGLGLLRVNFLIKEEIIINLDPQYSTKTLSYGDSYEIELTRELQNYPLCQATCTEILTDISKNKVLYINTFDLKNYDKSKVSYLVKQNNFGVGQNIYGYEIICKNSEKSLCPSTNVSFTRRAITTINYNPGEENTKHLNSFLESYNSLEDLEFAMQENLDEIEYSIDSTIYTNLMQEINKYNELRNYLSKVKLKKSELYDVLNQENYTLIKTSQKENAAFFEESKEYLVQTTALKNNLIIAQQAHNENIDSLEVLRQRIKFLQDFEEFGLLPDTLALIEINNAINTLIIKFDTKKFDNYSEIKTDIININKTLNLFEKEIKEKFIEFQNMIIYKTLYQELECIKYNSSENCNKNISYLENNSSLREIKLFSETQCLEFSYITAPQDMINPLNLEEQKVLLSLIKKHLENQVHLTQKEKLEKLKLDVITNLQSNFYLNTTQIEEITHTYYPKDYNITKLESTFNNVDIVDTNSISIAINNNILLQKNECFSNKTDIIVTPIFSKKETIPVIDISYLTHERMGLPKEKCCAYAECKICNEEKNKYPIIMLHGHSFDAGSSAYKSIEAFTRIQTRLIKDKKVIPTGILQPQLFSEETKNDLGKTPLSVLFTPTYYVEFYEKKSTFNIEESKNNNIDSYALRLKELIDYVKFVTGYDKVNLVSHSMGGLVSRRYMQIFGEDSINKFIMIGTPNKGIDKQIATLCKIFGETTECMDMEQDSLFLKKLNNDKPLSIPTYMIIGQGCEMIDGKDGDGIVLVENAEIKGATTIYVNGTCNGLKYLHTEMLNPDKYTELYEKLLEILEE